MMTNEHKTKRIAIKVADIDEKIVPLVKWLNSFESVRTLYCCQGSLKTDKNFNTAYILFMAENNEDLAKILEKIHLYNRSDKHNENFCFIKVEVEWFSMFEPLRYRATFVDQEAIVGFTKLFLEKNK